MFNHQRLKCYQLSLELTQKLSGLVKLWPSGTADLQDQLWRALNSILLNIAEGNERTYQKERKRFFNIAKASAAEVSAVLDIARARGWMDKQNYFMCGNNLVQVSKILYKLS